MNVLFLINYAGSGGTEAYVEALIAGLPSVRCALCCNVDGRLAQRLRAKGIPVFQLRMRHPFDRRAAKALAAYCRAQHIDLIHAQYPRENRIALLARRYGSGARVVYTAHLSLHQPLWWRVLNRSSKDDAVIALTDTQRTLLIQNGFSAERIYVIPNGVARRSREKRTPDGVFRMLTAARLSLEKGLLFLCDALSALRGKTTLPFRLEVFGEGPQRKRLERRIKKLGLNGIVSLRGFCEDVPFAQADLYVSPSRSETMSLALLEAMAAGLPVMATNASAALVKGICGLTTPYGDADAFSDGLLRLMTDRPLRERFAAAAPHYDIAETCRRTAERYQRSLHHGTEETEI